MEHNVLAAFPFPSPIILSLLVVIVAVYLHYVWAVHKYNQERKTQGVGQLPPIYPGVLPFIGNAFSFGWNTGKLLKLATSYRDVLTSTRISALGFHLYVFQDRETISKIMRHPSLASPMSLYVFGERFLFGMPKRGIAAYIADDSGPSAKPFPGSNVAPEKRVDYLLHRAFTQAWTGAPLASVSKRFQEMLASEIKALDIPNEWTRVEDFYKLFGKPVSSSVTQSIFGSALLQLNPDLIDNAWALDDALPWLFRQVPSFLMPRPYQLRKKLSKQIRRWYFYARQWYTDSCIYPDGDGDPLWGSGIIRHLQKELRQSGNRGFIDDECFAAHDMGLIWGSNSNVVAATILVAYHIFQDPALLDRVRLEIEETLDQNDLVGSFDPKKLHKMPLFYSVYAEVLRLYVDVLLIFSSPHEDVALGKWRLPRGEKALVSTSISHRDDGIWNTMGGLHPLDTFWGERFIVDPSNPLSGPIRPDVGLRPKLEGHTEPFFSTQGLESSWIPFGGGPSICPGRFLAKTVIMFTCVVLVSKFDIEVREGSLKRAPRRFGLGVAKPGGVIPAQIRRRA